MKKSLLALTALGLLAFGTAEATEYYLAPGGTGNGMSIDKPMGDPVAAFAKLTAGDILWVRGGTYNLSETIKVNQTGTKDARICVFAYENEKPVFDFSGQNHTDETTAKASRGILHNIGANYWHYRGLEICNAADNGMKLEGSFCVVELCTFHDNGDTGLQQGFGKGSKGENTRNTEYLYGRYNIIVNCDSYNNHDTWSNGGDADGFAIKLYPGPGNEFHGCRAWYNSDDAWDLYYTAFPIVVDNCWALKSGWDKGNGNGFKMGGCKQGGISLGAHVFKNCISAFNISKGYDQNHHYEGSHMLNCLAYKNKINFGFNMEEPTYGKWVLRNCVGFGGTERNHQFTEGTLDASYCQWIDIDNVNPISEKAGGSDATGNKYNKSIADYSSEYESLDYDVAIGARQENGELPLKFGRLVASSQFIDKGTPITNFTTTDAEKDYYAYSDNAPKNWSITLTIPYVGAAPDYGPYEYGGDDNKYTLVMPVNDGTTDEEIPDSGQDTDGRYWETVFIANQYLFQDAEIVDSIAKYITDVYTTTDASAAVPSVNPKYYGKSSDGKSSVEYVDETTERGQKYTGTYGAYRLPKTTWVEFTLPSLAAFKSNIYCTGGRTLSIEWYYKEDPSNKTTVTKDYSSGTYAVDIASLIGTVEKKEIVIKLTNTKGGDMYLTDITLGYYREVDENGDPIATAINVIKVDDAQAQKYDVYQTQGGLIVYGQINSLTVVNLAGRVVAKSEQQQFVNTSALPKGLYIVVIRDQAGNTSAQRFLKK